MDLKQSIGMLCVRTLHHKSISISLIPFSHKENWSTTERDPSKLAWERVGARHCFLMSLRIRNTRSGLVSQPEPSDDEVRGAGEIPPRYSLLKHRTFYFLSPIKFHFINNLLYNKDVKS